MQRRDRMRRLASWSVRVLAWAALAATAAETVWLVVVLVQFDLPHVGVHFFAGALYAILWLVLRTAADNLGQARGTDLG